MVSNFTTLATEIEDLHQTIRFHPGDYSII